MTKIIVNTRELKKYSQQLEENSIEFGRIRNNMQDIVESLTKRGWSGYDAETFLKNATEYLDDLKVIQDNLAESSTTVHKKNDKYTSRIEDFFESIKHREDINE